MELRHLRYFVAVAEEGSLKLAAEKRLNTAQPSLSRQIRDLESEVGAQLLQRGARGITLTAAGSTFLDHARLALAQAGAAVASARRAAKPVFAVGFVTGHEVDCIPPATRILRDDLSNLELRIFSGFTVDLASDVQRGRLDMAFVRLEPDTDLDYRIVLREPPVAVLRRDHRLAASRSVAASGRASFREPPGSAPCGPAQTADRGLCRLNLQIAAASIEADRAETSDFNRLPSAARDVHC